MSTCSTTSSLNPPQQLTDPSLLHSSISLITLISPSLSLTHLDLKPTATHLLQYRSLSFPDCNVIFRRSPNQYKAGGQTFHRISKAACLKKCLSDMNCTSVDYDHRTAVTVCHIHAKGETISKLVRAIGADRYTIVRLPRDDSERYPMKRMVLDAVSHRSKAPDKIG